ncbi:MAG TPA: biotin transporter BioY [Beutenbergiaceae bacterium]|nr:biotin transporter BioY [Beutenbergiaceae bacterium]
MTTAEEEQSAAPSRPPAPGLWLAPVDQTALAPASSSANSWRQRLRRISARAERGVAAGVRSFDARATPLAQRLNRAVRPLSRRAARVDLLTLARNIALIALGGLLIAAAGWVELRLPLLTAPLWLFVAAALLVGAALGAVRGFLATSLYLALGLLGASMDPGGAGPHVQSPWAGVLLSLPVAAAVTGAICTRHASLRSPVTSKWYFFGWFFFAALTGLITTYIAGLVLLAQRLSVDGWELFATMSTRFPFDVALCVLVAILAVLVRRLVPGLLGRGRTQAARPGQSRSVRISG